ncbi:bacteriocin immunity protein [Pseudomonas indica]|uniref:bacteriocin immunity protein n=1 Tax=Pseudomonas indica TaxID=137658 RepID=UPI003FD4FEF0
MIKGRLSEYTERDFKKLIKTIRSCEGKEGFQAELIAHFNALTAEAGGSDLIFWPEPGADNSTEGVVQEIKDWMATNGLEFKDPFV